MRADDDEPEREREPDRIGHTPMTGGPARNAVYANVKTADSDGPDGGIRPAALKNCGIAFETPAPGHRDPEERDACILDDEEECHGRGDDQHPELGHPHGPDPFAHAVTASQRPTAMPSENAA